MTKLVAEARGERDFVVTRQFDAPREKVWRALTETDLMRQWMTSDYGALKSLDGTAEVGGSHHFVWQGQGDGNDLEMIATYDLLEPPGRILRREAWPQHGYMESQIETRLIDEGAATTMQMTITFPSGEARDQAISFGMSEGMEAMYANLDGHLAG